jgi:heat shock protein HslJ
MKTRRIIFIAAATVLAGGMFLGSRSGTAADAPGALAPAADYRSIAYRINGMNIKLVEGYAETEIAPGAAAKIITRFFGNELRKDLNGDGREDVAFLLTQTQGGSGTFFYLVAALNTETGYVGSQGLLLGDRIAPQTTESGPGNSIVVNYVTRKPSDPMTAQPSVGKSLRVLLDAHTMQFGEVAQDFEGEADPSRMTLEMKTWTWVHALYRDGRTVTPTQPGRFTLAFLNGRFSATTDCNRMSGSYTTTKHTIAFGQMASTKMYCEGSQESAFASLLESAQGYHFTSKGELILDLKFESGSATFR